MQNRDEGYIKYRCNWIDRDIISADNIIQLNYWRDRLYRLGLIGVYDDGIGFGNLSIRKDNANCFIISGTKTGSIAHLTPQHYTKVTDFDWQENYVNCIGAIRASSESLTHAALYTANLEVNAVIHVHNLPLWENLLDRLPTTNKNCAYGTPEMAREIINLSQKDAVKELKIIIMSGHEEGIITFGKDLDEAGNILLDRYFSAQNN
ncbi:MAG: class II aldolase/adducin family protein [Prochloraceae cyanobacterium]